eukprot:TRINITY_DN7925_c0_g1_i1.p1 TRINITY_DN7925_c0_g1~~TRINITY_DN7925_c0_g1_i1.p1  ORF type:complete len:235 (+),score=39.65 TRINITY_DN7925_c0_g1_i1:99-707(+)
MEGGDGSGAAAEGSDCPVCLHPVLAAAEGEQAPARIRCSSGCRAAYHADCAASWLARSGRCPGCQGEVSREDVPELWDRIVAHADALEREEVAKGGAPSRCATVCVLLILVGPSLLAGLSFALDVLFPSSVQLGAPPRRDAFHFMHPPGPPRYRAVAAGRGPGAQAASRSAKQQQQHRRRGRRQRREQPQGGTSSECEPEGG